MNQKIKTTLLLLVMTLSLPSIAQMQKLTGKVTRIEGKSYVTQKGELHEIDDKTVLAKLKSEKSLPAIGLRNVHHIAMDNYSIPVPDSINVEKFVLLLEETDCFEFVEYNCVYSPCIAANDYYYGNQWYLSTINASGY